jgi:hypothetical protein
MAKLPLAVFAPTENFSEFVQSDGKSIIFADEAVDKLGFVHEKFLRTLYEAKFSLAPNKNLVFIVDSCGEFSCHHFQNFLLSERNQDRIVNKGTISVVLGQFET